MHSALVMRHKLSFRVWKQPGGGGPAYPAAPTAEFIRYVDPDCEVCSRRAGVPIRVGAMSWWIRDNHYVMTVSCHGDTEVKEVSPEDLGGDVARIMVLAAFAKLAIVLARPAWMQPVPMWLVRHFVRQTS